MGILSPKPFSIKQVAWSNDAQPTLLHSHANIPPGQPSGPERSQSLLPQPHASLCRHLSRRGKSRGSGNRTDQNDTLQPQFTSFDFSRICPTIWSTCGLLATRLATLSITSQVAPGCAAHTLCCCCCVVYLRPRDVSQSAGSCDRIRQLTASVHSGRWAANPRQVSVPPHKQRPAIAAGVA